VSATMYFVKKKVLILELAKWPVYPPCSDAVNLLNSRTYPIEPLVQAPQETTLYPWGSVISRLFHNVTPCGT